MAKIGSYFFSFAAISSSGLLVTEQKLYRPTKILTDISIDYRPTLNRYIERLSSDYQPSVNQPSTECWPITDQYIGQVSTNYQRKVGEVLVKYWWTKSYIGRDTSGTTIDCVSTKCRPTIVRVLTKYWPLYPLSVNRLLTAISTDRLVDTTYSKHDPL